MYRRRPILGLMAVGAVSHAAAKSGTRAAQQEADQRAYAQQQQIAAQQQAYLAGQQSVQQQQQAKEAPQQAVPVPAQAVPVAAQPLPPAPTSTSSTTVIYVNTPSPTSAAAPTYDPMNPFDTAPTEWVVAPFAQKYLEEFEKVAPDGFLPGAKAKDVLIATGAPMSQLRHIWELADCHKDGRLDCEEFALAMYFCQMAKEGKQLPACLTSEYIPPSQRDWLVLEHADGFYALFETLGPAYGKLSAAQASAAIRNTGAPSAQLRQIWELSDVDKNGCLDREEFALAMYLCEVAKAGETLPTVLTHALIPPSKRK